MAEVDNAEMSEVKIAAEDDSEQVEAEKEPRPASDAPDGAVEPAEAPAAEAEEPPAATPNHIERASAGHDKSSSSEPTASAPARASDAAAEQQQQQQQPVAKEAEQHPAEHVPAIEAEPHHAAAEAEPEQQQSEAEHHTGHGDQHEQQQNSSMRKVEEAHQQIQTSLNHTQHKHSPTAATSHRSMGPGTVYRSADGKMLTFTKPPYVYKARPYSRGDFSHSKDRLMEIAHANQLLVSHLTVISKQIPSWTKDASAPPAPGNTASAAVNRRKSATFVAQENHALYQRLVAIRPSKDISRDTLEAAYRQNEVYRANCAQFKATSKANTSH